MRLPTWPTFEDGAYSQKMEWLWRSIDAMRSLISPVTDNFTADQNRRYYVADAGVVTLPPNDETKVGDSVTLIGDIDATSYSIQANTGQTIAIVPANGVDMRFGQVAFDNDTINANDTLDAAVTVAGVATARSPRFATAFTASLPDGVVLKQIVASGIDTITATLENVTASPQNYTGNLLVTAIMEQPLALQTSVLGLADAFGPVTIKLVYTKTGLWQAEYYTGNLVLN